MTLKEKLNYSIITNIDIRESENRMYYEYNHLEMAEECEKIADDYAIEFARWLIDIDNKPKIHYTVKEMLEIFKKEKELLNQDL